MVPLWLPSFMPRVAAAQIDPLLSAFILFAFQAVVAAVFVRLADATVLLMRVIHHAVRHLVQIHPDRFPLPVDVRHGHRWVKEWSSEKVDRKSTFSLHIQVSGHFCQNAGANPVLLYTEVSFLHDAAHASQLSNYLVHRR